MFSKAKFINAKRKEGPDTKGLMDRLFSEFLLNNNYCAGFICTWDDNSEELCIVSVYGVNESSFRTHNEEYLIKFINECLHHNPSPHAHKVSGSPLWSCLARIKNIENWQHRVAFIPAYLTNNYAMLCFAENKEDVSVYEKRDDDIKNLIETLETLIMIKENNNRIKTMEKYAREIGHDIASSVQATIAKLRIVSRGRLDGMKAIDKIVEAEEEIMATYRIADTLGIAVDPDYNIRSIDNVDIKKAINEVINLCKSEAEERHIEIQLDYAREKIEVKGDNKALQSAVMQYLINSIKYAKGSSHIEIKVRSINGMIEVSIKNIGKSIDENEEKNMWKFGWRGEKAKELHVNGSGIGLYTVKKIIMAHGGNVWCRINGQKRNVITFGFNVPKKGDLTMLVEKEKKTELF